MKVYASFHYQLACQENTHTGLYLLCSLSVFFFSFPQTGSAALQCLRRLLSTLKPDRYCHLPPFEDGGMKEVEIITSVHQTHPGEEERGRGGKVRGEKKGKRDVV